MNSLLQFYYSLNKKIRYNWKYYKVFAKISNIIKVFILF